MIEEVRDFSEFRALIQSRPHWRAISDSPMSGALSGIVHDFIFEMTAQSKAYKPISGDPDHIVKFSYVERIDPLSKEFRDKYPEFTGNIITGNVQDRLSQAWQDFLNRCRERFVEPAKATEGQWTE
jgi:hypothetical protein